MSYIEGMFENTFNPCNSAGFSELFYSVQKAHRLSSGLRKVFPVPVPNAN